MSDQSNDALLQELKALRRELAATKLAKFNRRVPFGDLIADRDEIAREYGFGEGTTCYDSVVILGDVRVGRNTWIGPFTVLDGTGGGLEIGDFCSVSTGVQIYTHDTVQWAITLGKAPVERAPTRIGSGVYIGPNTIISKGVAIGNSVVIGANSFVNTDIPDGARFAGSPARQLPDRRLIQD